MRALKSFAYPLTLSLLLGSCIKRELRSDAPVVAAQAPTPASASAGGDDAAAKPATGNYGKVAGVDVLAGRGVRAFRVNGKAERVKASFHKVSGQAFDEAIRAEIKEASPNVWDVQIQAKITTPVEKGDVLLASLWFRTESVAVESGEGQSEFVFELAGDPWTKSVTHAVTAAREWKQVHVPFVAASSYGPGEAQAILRLGYAPEVIEFGGVKVENFGKQLALADLPRTQLTYPGMEPDAPWRAEAAKRIDELRKADLKITVQDGRGAPLNNAQVTVRQTKHAFDWGTCVPAALLTQPGNDRYKQLVPELFNMATLENDLKWVPLTGEWGSSFTMARAQQGIQWLHQHGLQVRGHVLMWPGWENLPKSLRLMEKEPDKLRAEIDKHIREVMTAVKGQVVHWDVLNEPFTNHHLLDILGYGAMADWFKLAHSIDPNAKLFINDFAILSGGGGTTPHRDHYEKMIQRLVDDGAPFDGIGMQGHFGTSLTGHDDLMKLLDRYGKFKKTIYITEYDVVIDDEALAARYTEDLFTTLFSHPAVGGIVMWGFWDGNHWKNNSPVYRKDWSLKPAGEVYRKLYLEKFRTNASGATDASGAYSTRAFLGTYEVEVTAGGQKKTATVTVGKPGSNTVVKIP